MRIEGFMRAPFGVGRVHLGYCTNIHAGETLAEVRAALQTWSTRVRKLVAGDACLGIGLRLSHHAAAELKAGDACRDFGVLLEELGLYVYTVNGFPYGTFHAAAVKEQVYEPDWASLERVEYTKDLAVILAALMPDSDLGSISTVPGCFRPKDSPQVRTQIALHLVEVAAHLWRLQQSTGREICLALEPEPHCMLETTFEAIAFFEQCFGLPSVRRMSELTGLDEGDAREALTRHLGVCLDACHAAVEFEDPVSAVQALQSAGIRIAKLQISCGLLIERMDEVSKTALDAFVDPVYLHQTVVKEGGHLRRYLDLPQALAAEPLGAGREWRVHYHVPVFLKKLANFMSTQGQLRALLQLQGVTPFTSHLEVETYTWDVLPDEYKSVSLDRAIAREIQWSLKILRGFD